MRRRPQSEPEALPPVDRARVRAILEEANVQREAGVDLHHHPALLALEDECNSILAYYVFAWCPDGRKLTAAELDELADGLLQSSVAP
jgi:hypothetical protein